MKLPRFTRLLSLLLLVALFSCEKDISRPVNPQEDAGGLRVGASTACVAFRYPDTLFFLREQSSDYVIRPASNQSGLYGASPGGLVINPLTGAINVTKSETGMKYRVWFVKTGTLDTCSRYVTISGVNYTSQLYRLAQNDTLAKPFYNAIRTLSTPCKDKKNDRSDAGTDCEFDDGRDDDDGDGTGDEPPAGQQVVPQGVGISKLIGSINLKETVANGTFGTIPVNGASKSIRIYYRLNDASRKALNYIDITLHYYQNMSSVPALLLNQISEKRGATLRRGAPGSGVLPNAPTMDLIRPRPPDIVIVGY